MDFDNEGQPDDQVFEDRGVKLVTDLKSFLYLCDTTLDYSDGLNGKGFHFVNPNATRTCGCGESLQFSRRFFSYLNESPSGNSRGFILITEARNRNGWQIWNRFSY